MWDYICPKCKEDVPKKSHTCPHCAENYGVPLRVPPRILKDPKALEAYVHKHVFPKVSQAHRDYLTQFFTVIFSDGFESGDFSAWTGTSGTPSVVTDQKHTGTYAMKTTVDNNYAYKTFTAQSDIYVRFYFRTSADIGNNRDVSMLALCNGTTEIVAVSIREASWQERLRVAASSNYEWNNDFPDNTWVCIEVRYKTGSGTGEIHAWVDGTERITQTGLTQTTQIDRINFGWLYASWAASCTLWEDCIVVADAYIGPEGAAQLQTVTDSLSLSDTILRNKGLLTIDDLIGLADTLLRNKTLTVADSVGAADAVLGNKLPLTVADSVVLSELINVITEAILKTVADQVSLSDIASVLKQLGISDAVTLTDSANVPSRILRVLDAAGLADNLRVDKVLQMTETVSLAEVVQVGVGGVKKTKLFLILGDLAVQLTSD